MAFAEKMRYLRKQKGLTQREMAKELGITSRTLQNYEAGLCIPRKEKVANRIADYFDVPLTYLIRADEEYLLAVARQSNKPLGRELTRILLELDDIFTCDSLADADKDDFVKSLFELYWSSKKEANLQS